MRGLLQSRRAYGLGIILGLVIILSPFRSLADDKFTYIASHANNVTVNNTTLYTGGNYGLGAQLTPHNANLPINATATITQIQYHAVYSGGPTNETSSLYLSINDDTQTVLIDNNLHYQGTTFLDKTYATNIQVNTNDLIALEGQFPVMVTSISNLKEWFVITLITSSTNMLSTTTDTIIGNVFNQWYLLGWFFFFIIVFWITFKITKR